MRDSSAPLGRFFLYQPYTVSNESPVKNALPDFSTVAPGYTGAATAEIFECEQPAVATTIGGLRRDVISRRASISEPML